MRRRRRRAGRAPAGARMNVPPGPARPPATVHPRCPSRRVRRTDGQRDGVNPVAFRIAQIHTMTAAAISHGPQEQACREQLQQNPPRRWRRREQRTVGVVVARWPSKTLEAFWCVCVCVCACGRVPVCLCVSDSLSLSLSLCRPALWIDLRDVRNAATRGRLSRSEPAAANRPQLVQWFGTGQCPLLPRRVYVVVLPLVSQATETRTAPLPGPGTVGCRRQTCVSLSRARSTPG